MNEPDGPEEREYEAMERHDAAMLDIELSEQRADESLSEVLIDIARTRITNVVRYL